MTNYKVVMVEYINSAFNVYYLITIITLFYQTVTQIRAEMVDIVQTGFPVSTVPVRNSGQGPRAM